MNPVEKFQELLRELFQFEASDLDFGIYRILNYRRDQIKKFINVDLAEKVETAFKKHKDERLLSIEEKFKEAKDKVIENFGKQAFTSTGEIKKEFKETPRGKEFLDAKAQKDEADKIDEIKGQVFTDLYNFFSRYYEEGDFVPQHRYSIKGHKYAIPYNGQEVTLYWANSGQYYTKTGVLFRDYTFYADDNKKHKVIFRTVEAKEELGSNKSTKARFFIPNDETPVELNTSDDGNKTLIIRFQYRELTKEEETAYDVAGGSNVSKQDKINIKSCQLFSEGIQDTILKALLEKTYKKDKSLLLYQITRFTATNSKDYFIHQSLERFLEGQLEYFIKDEVLSIDTLEQERFLDKHITRAKVVREIGREIIAFLAQLENFQKRLWEKKKFVLNTEYVITLDRIPDIKDFTDDILKNKAQVKEWKELGMINGTLSKSDISELKYKFLPMDTRYFTQGFKEKLLEKVTEKADLDNLLDGLLIKSENWQALNLLLNKYKEQVQTIYIDPPFNKEKDADYLYNVKFKDSTWISMLYDRINTARNLLNDRGSIFVRCDYNGNMYVRLVLNDIFGEQNFKNELIINRTVGYSRRAIRNLEIQTEFLSYYAKEAEKLLFNQLWEDREPKWIQMRLKWNKGGPTGQPIIIETQSFYPPEGYSWFVGNEIAQKMFAEGRLKIENGKLIALIDKKIVGSNWTDILGYNAISGWAFPTENHEILLKRAIELSSNESDLLLDFFLGSGTTTAVAHKTGRKWLGVEMGEHFYSVILPRMKKVLAYDKSGISKEKDVKVQYNVKHAGGFFKYQVLEQYEDSLDNIEFKSKAAAEALFKDEYLIKYFLDYESRESEYLLNTERLQAPFSYKLKVNREEVGDPEEVTVDIPETFNYLLGLKVEKMKVRNNGQRKYLFILGEKDGKDIAVVWREYTDEWTEENFKKDKEFIVNEISQWKPHIVYVNGQSVITPKLGTSKDITEIRYIEPEFKRLMEK